MPWAPDYVDLAQLKAQLRITDTDDDLALAAAITAASRAVDYECDRQFGNETEARYYTYEGLVVDCRAAVAIDDVAISIGMFVDYDDLDDGSWSQTTTKNGDWVLWPYNAQSAGRPWTHLLQRSQGTYRFPGYPQGIRVTATFGWTTVPAVVVSATLIQAARIFVRRDSAYGVAGSPDLGNELRLQDRLDPDVALLLKSVKRRWGAV